MPSVKYNCKQSLQEKVLKGVDVLADNVASTLGPRGRNVILCEKGKEPFITKDGVTVAKFVHLDDPFENVGVQILKQASEKTAHDAGDGTTTSTVLARAVLKQAQKYLIAGVSPIELKRGIDKTVEAIVENLKEQSRPVSSLDDIEHIATISANGDKTIGKLISMAIDQSGKNGSVTIEEARSLETSLDIVEGFRFDSGYVASAFVTDERRGAVKYNGPLILVADCSISAVEDILPALEVAARDKKSLIIIADEVDGQALAALIMNTVRGTMKVCAVKAPGYGEERRNILSDLALSVGATFITRSSGVDLKDVKLEHLGTAKTFEALKYSTTIVDGNGDFEEVDKRIESLEEQLTQTDELEECQKIQERITRLSSGIAIIRVGGATQVEVIEKKHRVEDALEAVKSAQEEGLTIGGGVALLRAVESLEVEHENDTQELGQKIILEAIKEPARQMAINAGLSPDLTLAKIENEEGNIGVDYATGDVLDLYEKGVIDPVKVTRCALQNAASAAGTLLTTNHAIVEV